MFVSADTMSLLMDSGVPADKLVEIIRAIERDVESVRPVTTVRSANAERQARFRQRQRGETEAAATSNVTDNATPVTQKVSPKPPSKNTSSSAPKGASSPPLTDTIAEQLWQTANPTSRNRSGRPATRRAVSAALAKGATPEALTASVRDHCRKSGDHAKGLHRIIEAELWREAVPKLEPPPAASDPAYRAHLEAHFRATGEWKSEWGERPRAAA